MKKVLFSAMILAIGGMVAGCSNTNENTQGEGSCCGGCPEGQENCDSVKNCPNAQGEEIVAEQVDVEASKVVNEPDGKQVVENEVKMTPVEETK